MLNNNYICCVDIGSSKLAACAARFDKRKLSGLFFEQMPSRGVNEGVIVDSIELIGSLSKLVKSLKTKSSLNIKYIYADICGKDIVTKHSRAIIPLAERGNKVITPTDIQQANEQARVLGSSLEEEIIHVIPSSYAIDSKDNIVNPLGLYSHRLEADIYLIMAKLSNVQTLSRVVNQTGLELKGMFLSGLATASAVFPRDHGQGVSIFCDIGSDVTEILFFRNGRIFDIKILLCGGDNLTKGLQEELKITFDLAEDIKRSHGAIGGSERIAESKEILVRKDALYKPIKERTVVGIVTKEAEGICSLIKEEVEKRVTLYEVNNFVISGRTLLAEGFIELLESKLGIPVKIGRINNPLIAKAAGECEDLSGQKYLTYITCLGMLCEAYHERPPELLAIHKPAGNMVSKAVTRFKEVYQEYF